MVPDKKIRLQYLADRYSQSKSYARPGYMSKPGGNYCFPALPQYVVEPSELEQSVDDPVEMISAGRRELARMKIGLLASQVACCSYVHGKNLEGIEEDELVCRNEMLKREAMLDYDGAQKINLDHVMRIQRELRAERSDFFRDTARLNKDLIEAVLEYKSMVKRGEMIEQL